MLRVLLDALAQFWVAEIFFVLLAGLCCLAAAYEVRNFSGSPSVRRYLLLALLCVIVAVVLYATSAGRR